MSTSIVMQNDECGIKKRWSGISCRHARWSRGSQARIGLHLALGAVLAALHSLVSHRSAELMIGSCSE